MLAIRELASAAADLGQLANQTDDRLAVIVVEIIPADRAIEHHTAVAAGRNPIVFAELLALREQRRAFRGQQGDQIRLNLGPVAVAISLLEQYVIGVVVDRDCTEVADETLMVM